MTDQETSTIVLDGHEIPITVTPVNDPATFDGDSSGAVTEGTSLIAHGQLDGI